MKKSKNLPDPLFSEADGGRRTEREETMGNVEYTDRKK